jgi:hypothetical protein
MARLTDFHRQQEVKAKPLAPFRARPCRHSVPPRDAALPPMEILPPRECERQLDPVLAHLLWHMSAPTQSSPSPPRAKPKHPNRDHPVSLLHRRGRPSDRLGARASGQVSARARPHARTQENTPACHHGARRRGQATFLPARSSEDMDAAFGRPMLTYAREDQGLAFLWPDLV